MARFFRGNIIALSALFIALGGTSFAATQLPKNSVGSKQIKRGAVTSSEVKNGSLSDVDLSPAAKAALQSRGGAAGPAGPAGSVDSLSVRVTRTSTAFPVPSCTVPASVPTDPPVPSTECSGLANTALEFNTERYDIGGFWALDAPAGEAPGAALLTIPKTGTYVVAAGARWESNATGIRSLSISGPNGAPPAPGILATNVVPASAKGVTVQNVSTVIRLTEGQKIYSSVGQNSGVSLNILGSLSQVHFAAAYVGP